MTTDDSQQKQRVREALRQFLNMSSTIDRHQLDFLPDTAADVLGDAANAAADETGTPNGDDENDPPTGDNDALISDFGFDMMPSTTVFDVDGSFEYDPGDDMEYTVIQGDDGGFEGIGMFDIGSEQLKMNMLKPVTLTIARTLVKHGLEVIGQAIDQANTAGLPGPTARTNCQAHLQWHQNKLAGLSGPPDSTIYDSSDDCKKWTMQAFVEHNSVEEGSAYLDAAWAAMWSEIADGLKKVPAQLAKLPGQAIEAVTGIPWWLVYGGGAVVIGGILYGAYKIITSEGGGRIIGGYLGGRR